MLSINPLLDLALRNRGITSADEIDYHIKNLLPISSLTYIDELTTHLLKFIIENKRIVIIADYDCDGATSCAVMIRMLKSLNANFGWLIPDRAKHGYGLTPSIVEDANKGLVTGDIQSLSEMENYVITNAYKFSDEDWNNLASNIKKSPNLIGLMATEERYSQKPEVILTVDNGIASLEGVLKANELGIDVLVTDHHLAGKTIPPALAIVNPNHPKSDFESKSLCGVGVAWYVCALLSKKAKEQGLTSISPSKLLPLVALGTIADVVKLDYNNRILVHQGLDMIRNNQSFIGIDALIDISNINYKKFNTLDIGFQIGPRINAAGRIQQMGVGVLNLITDNKEVAFITATQLTTLNEQRKEMSNDIEKASIDLLMNDIVRDYKDDYLIVLYPNMHRQWHKGVVGIVASRIKELTNKPTIVLSYDAETETYTGSCRSIPSLHFKDLLDLMALKDNKLMLKYGGHAMAAGVTLPAHKLQEFIKIGNQVARMMLKPSDLKATYLTDGDVNPIHFTLQNIENLQLQIWGQNFIEPVFNHHFILDNCTLIGTQKNHARLEITDQHSSRSFCAIYFNVPKEFDMTVGRKMHLLFSLSINEFRNNKTIQLMVKKELSEQDKLTYIGEEWVETKVEDLSIMDYITKLADNNISELSTLSHPSVKKLAKIKELGIEKEQQTEFTPFYQLSDLTNNNLPALR